MKKIGFIILILAVAGTCLWGCGKKEPYSEELTQEPVSIETLSTVSVTETEKAAPGIKPEVDTQNISAVPASDAGTSLQPLPPSGPYKPTSIEIQTALKNAGYYTGSIDGKAGSMTKKAIEDFQNANSLKADGKVGPKTWAVLSSYLNAAGEPGKAKKPAAKKR